MDILDRENHPKNKYGQEMNAIEFVKYIHSTEGIDGVLEKLNSKYISMDDVSSAFGATVIPTSLGISVHFPEGNVKLAYNETYHRMMVL